MNAVPKYVALSLVLLLTGLMVWERKVESRPNRRAIPRR